MDSQKDSRFVAYFDIMGFTDRYQREGHESVGKMMNRFAEVVSRMEQSTILMAGNALAGEVPNMRKIVRPVIFSDTVLFYSHDNSRESFFSLIFTASFFLEECILFQIPIKGAIAKGPFTANQAKSLYFGQPLIDAYNLAADVHFYGAVFHNSAQDDLQHVHRDFYFTCKAPLKFGGVTHSILALPNRHNPHFMKEREESVRKFFATSSGSVRKYVDNTLEVYFQGNPPLN